MFIRYFLTSLDKLLRLGCLSLVDGTLCFLPYIACLQKLPLVYEHKSLVYELTSQGFMRLPFISGLYVQKYFHMLV